jgi:hypothetical protein
MSNISIIDTIVLDSKDRESSSSSTTNFEIKLPFSNSEVTFFKIKEVSFPLSQDNVLSSNNTFEIDGVPSSIDVGQYNITSLINWLSDNITGYTFTYEPNGRVKISSDALVNFSWEPLESSVLLGFTNSTFAGATSYTGTLMPDLLPSNYYTLHSNFISKRQRHYTYHSDSRSNLIMTIAKKQDLGSLLVYRPNPPVLKYVTNTNSDLVDFQIRDSDKNIIDIGTNTVLIIIERMR